MSFALRTLTTVTLVLIAGTSLAADKDEIRKLIPAATAMKNADFKKLTTSQSQVNPDDFEDRSFTLEVMMLQSSDKRTREQIKEFNWLGGIPKPADLAQELNGSVRLGKLSVSLRPVTAVHGNRLTDITCEVTGDDAKGTFAFLVPKLYEGTANYIARREDGRWQITELLLPEHKIRLVRGEDGLWVKQ